MLTPRIRLPLWLAIVLPLAAYAFRSIALRGGDWRPDLPWDAVLFIGLAILITLVAWARANAARLAGEPEHDEGGDPDEPEHRPR